MENHSNINNQFVSYQIAEILKYSGFNEWCLAYQNKTLVVFENYELSKNSQFTGDTLAIPLWQQVIDWLRESYNYHISLYRLNNKWCGDVYAILRQCYITSNAFDGVVFDSYYEAREKTILRAIRIIKNGKSD